MSTSGIDEDSCLGESGLENFIRSYLILFQCYGGELGYHFVNQGCGLCHVMVTDRGAY